MTRCLAKECNCGCATDKIKGHICPFDHSSKTPFKWCVYTRLLALEYGGPSTEPKLPADLRVLAAQSDYYIALINFNEARAGTKFGGLSEEEADAWDVVDSMPVGGLSDWEEPQLQLDGTLADVPGLTGNAYDDEQDGLRCTFQSEIH